MLLYELSNMHSIPAINAGESASKLVEQTRFHFQCPPAAAQNPNKLRISDY